MSFSSVVRTLTQSPLLQEFATKLTPTAPLELSGLSRLAKGLVSSALCLEQERPLCVITATLEEAGRWTVQLETAGWSVVALYPTVDTIPYESLPPEPEVIWGQMQVLADLLLSKTTSGHRSKIAIVATIRALQPHLPSVSQF